MYTFLKSFFYVAKRIISIFILKSLSKDTFSSYELVKSKLDHLVGVSKCFMWVQINDA